MGVRNSDTIIDLIEQLSQFLGSAYYKGVGNSDTLIHYSRIQLFITFFVVREAEILTPLPFTE